MLGKKIRLLCFHPRIILPLSRELVLLSCKKIVAIITYLRLLQIKILRFLFMGSKLYSWHINGLYVLVNLIFPMFPWILCVLFWISSLNPMEIFMVYKRVLHAYWGKSHSILFSPSFSWICFDKFAIKQKIEMFLTCLTRRTKSLAFNFQYKDGKQNNRKIHK